jgi:hypothetical protein
VTAPLPLAVQLYTRDPDADGAAAFTLDRGLLEAAAAGDEQPIRSTVERPPSLSPGIPAQVASVAP